MGLLPDYKVFYVTFPLPPSADHTMGHAIVVATDRGDVKRWLLGSQGPFKLFGEREMISKLGKDDIKIICDASPGAISGIHVIDRCGAP